jgi:hypothetical protein
MDSLWYVPILQITKTLFQVSCLTKQPMQFWVYHKFLWDQIQCPEKLHMIELGEPSYLTTELYFENTEIFENWFELCNAQFQEHALRWKEEIN